MMFGLRLVFGYFKLTRDIFNLKLLSTISFNNSVQSVYLLSDLVLNPFLRVVINQIRIVPHLPTHEEFRV